MEQKWWTQGCAPLFTYQNRWKDIYTYPCFPNSRIAQLLWRKQLSLFGLLQSKGDQVWQWMENHFKKPYNHCARLFNQSSPRDWTHALVSMTMKLKENYYVRYVVYLFRTLDISINNWKIVVMWLIWLLITVSIVMSDETAQKCESRQISVVFT